MHTKGVCVCVGGMPQVKGTSHAHHRESRALATCAIARWGRVPSVHRACNPVLAWPIKLLAYAMPSVPVPLITLLTDVVPDADY